MCNNFWNRYKEKIAEIEQHRIEEIIEIEKALAEVKKKKVIFGVILTIIFAAGYWPIFKIGGVAATFLTIPFFIWIYKLGSCKFKKNDHPHFFTFMIKRRAQLSLAGSLYGNHRKLFDWGPESRGAMFEIYWGLKYEGLGYIVEYKGLVYRQCDQGVDLICKKGDKTLLVQCKYWKPQSKVQLDTTQKLHQAVKQEIEKSKAGHEVRGVIITSSQLTENAKETALRYNIDCFEKQKITLK